MRAITSSTVLAILAGLIVATVPASDAAADNLAKAKATELYQRGLQLQRQKSWSRADSHFALAYSMDPQPRYVAARCIALAGGFERIAPRFKRHVEVCELALKKMGSRASAELKAAAKKLFAARDRDEALQAAKGAERNANARHYAKAIEYMNKALRLDPQPKYHLQMCQILAKAEKLAQASAHCKTALRTAKSKAIKAAAQAMLSKVGKAKAVAPTADQKKLLHAVYRATYTIPDPKHIDSSQRPYAIEKAKRCVTAVQAAQAGGIPLTREVRVENHDLYKTRQKRICEGCEWAHFTALGNVKRMCDAILLRLQSAGVLGPLEQAEQALVKAKQMQKTRSLTDTEIVALTIYADPCTRAVKAALASGLASSTALPLSSGRTVTLGTADAKVCKALVATVSALKGRFAKLKGAALEAKLKPYRRHLRGGKMKVLARYSMYDLYVYTRGKRRLRRPRDFARASLWFQEMTYRCGGYTCWRVRRFQFRGNKLLRTTTKTGRGSSAPRRAFR